MWPRAFGAAATITRSEAVTQTDTRHELRVRTRIADERRRRADLSLHGHVAACHDVAARSLLIDPQQVDIGALGQRVVDRTVDLMPLAFEAVIELRERVAEASRQRGDRK